MKWRMTLQKKTMYQLSDITIKLLTHTVERIEGVEDKDYFGERYKEFVSNSLLALLNPDQGGSPGKFMDGFKGKESPALELGSAVHQMILEREKYFLSEVEKPTGKVGDIVNSAYEAHQRSGHSFEDVITQACMENDYYSNALTTKRIDTVVEKGREYFDFLVKRDSDPSLIVLTASMKERLKLCMESVKANPLITSLILPNTEFANILSFNEDVVVMEAEGIVPNELFEDVILFKLKAKLDNWSIDFDNKIITLNDLKTTSSAVQNFGGRMANVPIDLQGTTVQQFIPGSFQKYHYPRQMAKFGPC